MAFRPYEGQTNVAKTVSVQIAASTAITAGQALTWSSGYLVPATSAATEVFYVAKQALASTAAATFIDAWRVSQNSLFEADCTSNTAVTQRGTKVDLTDGLTLNNTTSSTKCFYVENTVGAAANKTVLGYFIPKVT